MQSHVYIRPKVAGLCPSVIVDIPHQNRFGVEAGYVEACRETGHFLMTAFGTVPNEDAKAMADSVRSMPWFDGENYQVEAEIARQSEPRQRPIRVKVPAYAL